ncbi:MAG TPA: cation diffusion facilitator family transporter, partial [Deinococcales bacterium]|nr:cation diffusion facilitator family transporter [Deinococcales bacterium]
MARPSHPPDPGRPPPPGGHAHPPGAHGHAHPLPDPGGAFLVGVAANAAFVVAEVVAGLSAHSLALVTDAGHNAGDVLGLAGAWLAAVLSRRRPSGRQTYGLGRTSILAAVANAVLLLITVGAIAVEAIRRLGAPGEVHAGTVTLVAALGILVNGGTAVLFARGRERDLNLRAAFQHLAADAVLAAGVVAAGLVMNFTRAYWLDPVVSLVLAVTIVVSTWGLLRDSLNLALDAVPEGVDLE